MTRYLFTILWLSMLIASNESIASDHGIVNFNLGRSPVNDSPVQSVSLLGCNTSIDSNLFWDTDNQIVGNIPYGWHESKSKKRYFASKYYVVSPPAFRKGSADDSQNQQPFIGLVTPDRFNFKGEKPAQIVYFDYRILNPTYLTHVEADYHHDNENGKSCADLGVNLIPINTQCSDFPWRNGALGAAGIGFLTSASNKVFLPTLKKNDDPLQCKVSLLNDIMLDVEVWFAGPGKTKSTSIDLTEYHRDNKQMKLICMRRPQKDIPSGCLPPQ